MTNLTHNQPRHNVDNVSMKAIKLLELLAADIAISNKIATMSLLAWSEACQTNKRNLFVIWWKSPHSLPEKNCTTSSWLLILKFLKTGNQFWQGLQPSLSFRFSCSEKCHKNNFCRSHLASGCTFFVVDVPTHIKGRKTVGYGRGRQPFERSVPVYE